MRMKNVWGYMFSVVGRNPAPPGMYYKTLLSENGWSFPFGFWLIFGCELLVSGRVAPRKFKSLNVDRCLFSKCHTVVGEMVK